MKKIFTVLFCISTILSFSQENEEILSEEAQITYLKRLDSINESFNYDYGKISLENGLLKLIFLKITSF